MSSQSLWVMPGSGRSTGTTAPRSEEAGLGPAAAAKEQCHVSHPEKGSSADLNADSPPLRVSEE